MTMYFITGQTGLQWAAEADSELGALEDFDQNVGIDPHDEGLEKILEEDHYTVEAIYTLDDLLEYLKESDAEDLDALNCWNKIPTFGGDMPDDTTHVWSWDEEHLLIGACSDEYEIVTREEWGE